MSYDLSDLSKAFHAVDTQIRDNTGPLPEGDRCILFCGTKGSSKSTTILNLLTVKGSPYRKKYKYIWFCSPTAKYDGKMKELWDECEEDGQTYEDISDEIAEELIEKIKAINESDPKAHHLVLIDDLSHRLPLGSKPSKITSLFTLCRHLRTSVWLVTHRLVNVCPLIRNNLDALFCFKTSSKKELDTYTSSFNVNEKQFKRLFKHCTSQPYSWLLVNMTGHTPRYYNRFEPIIEPEED